MLYLSMSWQECWVVCSSFKFSSGWTLPWNSLTKVQSSNTHRIKRSFFPRFNFKKRSRAIARICIFQRPMSLAAFCISGKEEQAGSISCRSSVPLISACSKSTHTCTHVINAILGHHSFLFLITLEVVLRWLQSKQCKKQIKFIISTFNKLNDTTKFIPKEEFSERWPCYA